MAPVDHLTGAYTLYDAAMLITGTQCIGDDVLYLPANSRWIPPSAVRENAGNLKTASVYQVERRYTYA